MGSALSTGLAAKTFQGHWIKEYRLQPARKARTGQTDIVPGRAQPDYSSPATRITKQPLLRRSIRREMTGCQRRLTLSVRVA